MKVVRQQAQKRVQMVRLQKNNIDICANKSKSEAPHLKLEWTYYAVYPLRSYPLR